jgi:thiosulfate/3-mercaptopyruvate sulfurtransferase
MNRLRLFVLVLALAGASSQSLASDDAPVLVSPSWLADHLNDPDMVVINVSQSIRDYRRGHIPGARFLWPTSVAAANTELSFELVSVEQLDTLLEGLGISNDSRIVLCGVNGNVSATARVYITLDYLGMGGRTSILDGGFEEWKASGKTVSREATVVRRSSFTPHLNPEAIVNADYVKARLKTQGVSVVDARAAQFYNGNGGGFPRTGHIPGAVNLFFATLVDSTNKFLPLDSLQAKFNAAGVHAGDEVIAYCHVGQTASTVYLAAKRIGYKVHLYDGSFEDWSGRDDLPIEMPPPAEKK